LIIRSGNNNNIDTTAVDKDRKYIDPTAVDEDRKYIDPTAVDEDRKYIDPTAVDKDCKDVFMFEDINVIFAFCIQESCRESLFQSVK